MAAKRWTIIFILVMLVPVSVHAVSIRAVVDKTSMTMEETLTLTVSVEDADADIDISALKDFSIVSQSTGTSFKWINGKSSHEKIYTYMLSPLKKGRLIIPPISMEYKGKTYKTEPIYILVQDTPVTGEQRRDIFVKARVSDTFPYVGQQIVYLFSLYYDTRITNPSLSLPGFDGFVAKQVDKDKESATIINGRRYRVFERRVILIPIKEGIIDIPPAVFSCDKVVEKNRRRMRDPFDSFFDTPFFNTPFFGGADLEHRIFRTKPLSVKAVPLPENPYKEDFSGLVGHVDLTGKVDRTNIKAGDSVTLTITVEGTGNLTDIEAPKVNAPGGVKVYPDNPEEDIKIGPAGYYGKKVFRFALVPVKEGKYGIPPVRLNYFDVKDGKYRILSTPVFKLDVAPSEAGKNGAAAVQSGGSAGQEQAGPPVIKKRVKYTGHDILPLKESMDGVQNRPGMPFYLYIILLVFPMIAAGVVNLVLVYMRKAKPLAAVMAARAKESLKLAGKKGISDEQFLSCLYRALVSSVFARVSESGETLTASEMRQLLSGAGVEENIIQEAETLLDRIESARFGGSAADHISRADLLDKTMKVVRRLIK